NKLQQKVAALWLGRDGSGNTTIAAGEKSQGTFELGENDGSLLESLEYPSLVINPTIDISAKITEIEEILSFYGLTLEQISRNLDLSTPETALRTLERNFEANIAHQLQKDLDTHQPTGSDTGLTGLRTAAVIGSTDLKPGPHQHTQSPEVRRG